MPAINRDATTHTAAQTFAGGVAHSAGSFSQETVVTGITAAGTTVADATALTGGVNVVTTAAASTGVKLPAAANGATIRVQNLGANDLEVYPPDASGVINGAAAGAGITLAAATDVIGTFTKISTNLWMASVAAGPTT
jgi:hypothetical protein